MEEPGGGWRRRLSPTTPVGIVFFKQTPFYSITWKHPVVVASAAYDRLQWQPYPARQAASSGSHTQVGGHPIQPIFAVESLTINDYNISLLSTEVSPAFIHLWRSGGWKVVNARMEEPGGGRRRRILNKSFYLLTTNCCGKEKFRHQNCLHC